MNEEKKAYNIALQAKILRIRRIFQNFEVCSLKKTATNLFNFKEIKILIF